MISSPIIASVIKTIPFAPTSKQCRKCGVKKDNLPLSERTFKCGNCSHQEDRDIHAAKNIEKEGYKKIPRAARKFTRVEISPLPSPLGPRQGISTKHESTQTSSKQFSDFDFNDQVWIT